MNDIAASVTALRGGLQGLPHRLVSDGLVGETAMIEALAACRERRASCAACRLNGLTYNRFIEGLRKSGLELDRKILAELAVSDPGVFTGIVRKAEQALQV